MSEPPVGSVTGSANGSGERLSRPESGSDLREAVETSLEALKTAGRLEPVDAARIAGIRSMAAALDGNPRNARLWRRIPGVFRGFSE
jgi:hypothetical protein